MQALLRLSKASSSLPSLSRLRVPSSVPPAISAAAIEALLELKDMLLVEPGLEEVVSTIASHLDSLQVRGRQGMGGL